MADTLIIVDSPVKKKFFDANYSGDAEVYVSVSPVAQPAHKGNGSGFAGVDFHFSVTKDGQDTAAKLAEYHDKNIIVAFDSDPRSEYLGWLISSYVRQTTKGANTVKRLTLSGVKEEELQEALDFVSVVDEQQGINFYIHSLFDAFLTRHLIRLVGTSRGPGNFPLQHTSLSPMFLLADRETEIQMFRPNLKWQVMAELSLHGHFFQARLEEAFDLSVDGFFRDEKQARWIRELIDDDPFVVDTITRTPLVIQPPSPYLLIELLHDALALYGIGPKDTLTCLRKLFHGVEVGGKLTGVISSFASLENSNTGGWLKQLREEVVAQFGQEALGNGVVEPVTGMIFPLIPKVTAAEISGLDDSEAKIYEAIRCRALASQMKDATGEKLKIDISAGPEAFFGTQYRTVSEKGFLAVYQGRYEKSLLVESPFSSIEEEQVLNLIKLNPEQTGGMPAEHYTIESLFTDLADFSIASDPVNISLIQGMINAGYIVIAKDGYLKIGENIKKVTSILNKAFPYMQGVNLSAYIQQTIDEASSGRKGLEFALKQFDQALILQGRSLVKAKLPSSLKPRLRRSSTIIKQVEETPSPRASQPEQPTPAAPAELPAESELKGALVEAGDETVVGESSGQIEQVAEKAQGEAVEYAAEVTDETALQGSEETVAEEESLAVAAEEAAEEESAAAADEVVVEAMVEVEGAFLSEETDEWPDELKDAFEAALQETQTQEDTAVEGAAIAAEQMVPEEKIVETDTEHLCQVCGKPMLLKEDRFGRFWSCSGFPACRHTEAYSQEAQAMFCPICRESKIVSKRTPAGKAFYVCMDSDCEFMSWAKPHYVSCNLCDSLYLVEKKSSSGKITLRCPKAGCDYSQSLDGEAAVIEETSKPKKRIVRVRRKAGSASLGTGSGGKKKVRLVRRKKK